MAGLELTPYIWFDGKIIPSEEAKIHVLTLPCTTERATLKVSVPISAPTVLLPSFV